MKFTKMHGLGNDFMVIDAITQEVSLSPDRIIRLARRDIGVGFDQCLLLEKSQEKDVDFFYRIYNADGNEVAQCGNGARCLARFIQARKLSSKTRITVATHTTRMQLQIDDFAQVSVFFPPPKFSPSDIPLDATKEADTYPLTLDSGKLLHIHALSVGNPHAVLRVEHADALDLENMGAQISRHPLFPQHCNAGFMQILSQNELRLRVYERGCGETRACGSGALAAAIVGRRFYGMQENISVILNGGVLHVYWPGQDDSLSLSGPAEFVYEGELL